MTVTCTATGCVNQGRPYDVTDDGLPVECGGCGRIIANGAPQ